MHLSLKNQLINGNISKNEQVGPKTAILPDPKSKVKVDKLKLFMPPLATESQLRRLVLVDLPLRYGSEDD